MRLLLLLMTACTLACFPLGVDADPQPNPVLGTAAFTTKNSAASIRARIDELGPLDLVVTESPGRGLSFAPGETLHVAQFAPVLAAAIGDPALAEELLEDAFYASFTMFEEAGETRIQLVTAQARSAREDDKVFRSIFGAPAPADFHLIQSGVATSGQHVFRLERGWRSATEALSILLETEGYLVYEMAGPSDTLVFAERTERALVLFIQHDPNGDATRVVVNFKE